MKAFKNIEELLNSFRGSGSTSANAKAALECGGYYIVSRFAQKEQLKREYPGLKVYSILDIPTFMRGIEPAPLFFDTTAIYDIISEVKKIEQILYKIRQFLNGSA
jgi:hypothetical protein